MGRFSPRHQDRPGSRVLGPCYNLLAFLIYFSKEVHSLCPFCFCMSLSKTQHYCHISPRLAFCNIFQSGNILTFPRWSFLFYCGLETSGFLSCWFVPVTDKGKRKRQVKRQIYCPPKCFFGKDTQQKDKVKTLIYCPPKYSLVKINKQTKKR